MTEKSEEEALEILGALSENELRDAVVRPYFEREGWAVEIVDRKDKLGHDCDLLLRREQLGEEEIRGVQLKGSREGVSTPDDVERKILPNALAALSVRFGERDRQRLSRYYWITTGSITTEGREGIRELIDRKDSTGGRVEVWDGTALFRQLCDSGVLGAIPQGGRVFVSYSHKDRDWLDRLRTMLVPLVRHDNLDLWDDSRVSAGARWKEEIMLALASARVAVLLVSPDFLASKFIAEEELPSLLQAAEARGVLLLWVCIRPCLWQNTKIADYQAAHEPGKPLSGLKKPDREKQLTQVCKEIEKALRSSRNTNSILPLQALYAKIQQRQEPGGIFTAHWIYREFRLQLLRSSPNFEQILILLRQGLTCLDDDRYGGRYSYYPRLFAKVFASWQSLIEKRPDLVSPSEEKLELTLERAAIKEFFVESSSLGVDAVTMLQDFELSFRQLVKLEERYVDGPAGLSTLVICRLLLRFGFSPSEKGIKARFDRMTEELKGDWEHPGASIDDQCSLCTGVLLSCFSLARRQAEVQRVKEWLLSLGKYRFSHILPSSDDRKADESALHYASQALLGLLDCDPDHDELLAPVLDVFFYPEELKPSRDLWRGFYREWLRHSNIDRFEGYRFILGTFLRFFLSCRSLSPQRTKRLQDSIRALARDLRRESPDANRIHLFYPTRSNLSSLVLGQWLGIAELKTLTLKVGRLHHQRASRAGRRKYDQLWDSNIDRTVIFVEGLLDYWETMVALEEKES